MKNIQMKCVLHKNTVSISVVDELGIVHELLWDFRNQSVIDDNNQSSNSNDEPDVNEQLSSEGDNPDGD